MIKDQITNLFKKNFIDKADHQPIVIYGIGEWTRLILERYPEAPIYGLLDGHFCEGKIKGKPIIALESLKGKKVKIVIVARKASEIVVYKRIEDWCKRYHIPVFNLNGICLNPSHKEIFQVKEWNTSSLYKELATFPYVSFDIFDTLLIRKTCFRKTLYQAIGRIRDLEFDFCQMRLWSEQELRKNSIEPTLKNIYEWIGNATGISSDRVEDLKNLEICLETENLVPRKEITEIYNKLIKRGVRIWIISDMYFPKELLVKILAKNGIKKYEDILVSCEYGVNKQNGLFQKYLCQAPAGRKAHVGDSREIDGYCAEESGLISFVIPSVMELAMQKVAKNILMNYEEENLEYIRGLSFSRLFYGEKLISSMIWVENGYQLGFCLVAPVLYGWAQWVHKCCMEMQIDKVLFVSRDGYLLEKIFQKICDRKRQEIDTEYLKFSRSLGWRASIYTKKDLKELIWLPFAGTISEWLKERFDIQIDDERNFVGNEVDILLYEDLILNESEKIRERYRIYWRKNQIETKKMALIDFVSTGTCQRRLEKLTECQLQGFYFEALSSSDNMLMVRSYIRTLWDQDPPAYNYLLWELLIKEPGASVKSIDSNGSFVYGQKRLSGKEIDFVQEVHRGVLDFVDQYISELECLQVEEKIDRFVQAAFLLLDNRYVTFGKSIKEYLRGFDEFTNREIVL